MQTAKEINRSIFSAWLSKLVGRMNEMGDNSADPPARGVNWGATEATMASDSSEREVGRDKVSIWRTAEGKVVIHSEPKDKKDTAADGKLERVRDDNTGGVTIIFTPRDATAAPSDED